MPSVSARQARFMRAAAHDAKFAKRAGIDQATAREFVKADRRKSMSSKERKKARYKDG